MMGFKAFYSAAATLAGIKVAHMIRKNRKTLISGGPMLGLRALALAVDGGLNVQVASNVEPQLTADIDIGPNKGGVAGRCNSEVECCEC